MSDRIRSASIALIALLSASVLAAQQKPLHTTTAPDSARIVYDDVDRFWRVVDRAKPDSLLQLLEGDYLDAATPGLRDYVPNRIVDAFNLARDVYNSRDKYLAIRAATLHAREAEPSIRASFHKLASLFPGARFPDVYFIIGRFRVGGVTTQAGIVVAAEIYDDPAKLPGIVAHELVHTQQNLSSNAEPLLTRALREGGADFIGELISGVNINPPAQAYGRAHEHELWGEFRRVMHDANYLPWMYVQRSDGLPNDLGYFMGYRIAQAYYERAADKRAAVRDIILMRDPADLLARSGYDP